MIINQQLLLERINRILRTRYELHDDFLIYNTSLSTEGTLTLPEINTSTISTVLNNLEVMGITLTPMASHNQIYDIYEAIIDLNDYDEFIQSIMCNSVETPTGTLLTLLELVAQDEPYDYLQVIDYVDPIFIDRIHEITKKE